MTYGSGLGTRKKVASGQALDVSIMFAPFPEALATGNMEPERHRDRRLGLGVAVPEDAPSRTSPRPKR